MQSQAFFFSEIVIFIVRDKIDDRAVGQRRGLVEHEPAFFDASSQRTHGTTVRFSDAAGKRSDVHNVSYVASAEITWPVTDDYADV